MISRLYPAIHQPVQRRYGITLGGRTDQIACVRGKSFATILFLFESNSRGCGIQRSKPIVNNQPTTDKAGGPRRLKIMKNDQSIYGILAGSEEKGREAMETAVYATCILSVVAAIFQFIGQPAPDPFAGIAPIAQPVPVVSHAVEPVWETKS
jgi:hypothetical protein